MLVAFGTIASAQLQGTENTMKATTQLLDYAASHPDVKVCFEASNMVLYVHSDASCLSEPKARSRIGVIFWLGKCNGPPKVDCPNGHIHIETRILKHVVAAALETEIAALFHN